MAVTYLKKGVSSNDIQEPLQPLAASLNYLVGEAVGENLSRKGWNVNPCRLALKNIAECLKVGVAPTHKGMAQFKSRDISL